MTLLEAYKKAGIPVPNFREMSAEEIDASIARLTWYIQEGLMPYRAFTITPDQLDLADILKQGRVYLQ